MLCFHLKYPWATSSDFEVGHPLSSRLDWKPPEVPPKLSYSVILFSGRVLAKMLLLALFLSPFMLNSFHHVPIVSFSLN